MTTIVDLMGGIRPLLQQEEEFTVRKSVCCCKPLVLQSLSVSLAGVYLSFQMVLGSAQLLTELLVYWNSKKC